MLQSIPVSFKTKQKMCVLIKWATAIKKTFFEQYNGCMCIMLHSMNWIEYIVPMNCLTFKIVNKIITFNTQGNRNLIWDPAYIRVQSKMLLYSWNF